MLEFERLWNPAMLAESLREGAEYIGPDNYEFPIMLYDNLLEAAEIIENSERKVRMKVKLDDNAIIPVRAHSTDAGLDLISPVNIVLNPSERIVIDTGVHVQIPEGHFGEIKSKSGLMAKRGITSEGTIDAGYTGSIKAVLFNHGNEPFLIHRGMKITQLVILPCVMPELEIVDFLDETERGNGSFGSTGD